MAAVYGNSYINIAVSSSTNVYEGFALRKQYYSSGFQTIIKGAYSREEHYFYPGNLLDVMAYQTHLSTRAWAFQEKLLSPRTLHIGDRGLFWECRGMKASDTMPKSIEARDLFSAMVNLRLGYERWEWEDVVKQFTKANLTYPSDKLPALAGIARRQEELGYRQDGAGSQYIAGMWRDNFGHEICWKRQGEPRKRADSRAPTWSWASVDGEICLRGGYMEAFPSSEQRRPRITDAWTKLCGPDPYGSVSGGEFTILCTELVHIRLSTDDSWFKTYDEDKRGVDCLDDVALEDGMVPLYNLPLKDVGSGIALQEISGKKGYFRRVGFVGNCAMLYRLASGDPDFSVIETIYFGTEPLDPDAVYTIKIE
jgi:hypothetical protein